MVSLARAFVAGGGTPFDDAERTLGALVARAATAHPALNVPPEVLASHLGRHLAGEPHPDRVAPSLHLEDLHLALACARGDARAVTLLDATWLGPAIAYARRVHRTSDGLVDEAAQKLRVRLLVREPDREPSILTYGGRSALGAWLRVTAIRETRYLLRRGARDAARHDSEDPASERVAAFAGRTASPELSLLKREGGESMSEALERVLRALEEQDRVLLRLYFIEGMSLATLGRIYHVHESTMARRLQELRGRLLDDVKRDLSIGTTSVHDLKAIVESQLDVHLSELLRRAH